MAVAAGNSAEDDDDDDQYEDDDDFEVRRSQEAEKQLKRSLESDQEAPDSEFEPIKGEDYADEDDEYSDDAPA